MLFHIPVFCSSRSIFLVLDFITDVDADKSEFIAEPGTTEGGLSRDNGR